jgi:hypothetical protein
MRFFLVGCLAGALVGVLINTQQATHGPLYPATEIALWAVGGGFVGLVADLCSWLPRRQRPFMRPLGIRLLVLGTVMMSMVAIALANQTAIALANPTTGPPPEEDQTLFIPVFLAGGLVAVVGAACWCIADRKRESG